MNGTKNQPLWQRMGYALAGLAAAAASERSLRVELAVMPVVALVLLLLRVEAEWWALAGLACALVLAAELFNTALEKLCDHLHPARHPAIGIVKDCAAAGVLLSCLGSLAVAVALAVHLWHRDLAPPPVFPP